MQQLDLEFPKPKYNFFDHVIGHYVSHSWNRDQLAIEDCYKSIDKTKVDIEKLYSDIDAIESRNKNMKYSNLGKSGLKLAELSFGSGVTFNIQVNIFDIANGIPPMNRYANK